MKKIIISAAAAAVLLSNAAYAVEPEIEFDYNSGKLTIQGTTEKPNETITLNILKPGVDIEQLYGENGESILHNDYTVTDGSGRYVFNISIPEGTEKGQYIGYIGASSFDSPEEFTLAYMSGEEYSEAIERLSAAAGDADEFKKVLSEIGSEIGFTNSLTDSVDADETAELLRNAVSELGLSTTDSGENKRIYDTVTVIQAFNENKMTDFADYADSILIDNENTIGFYKDIISGGSGEQVFINAMSGKNISGIDEFETALEDAVMISVARYPDGIGNIEKVLKEYKDRTGAKTESAKNANYSAVAGRTYSSVDALIEAFNDSVESNGSGGGSGSGGGGGSTGGGGGGGSTGGGGGSVSSSHGNIASPINPSNPTAAELGIKFEDLNSVPWAYEAISKLFSAGVISGRSETIFAPNDFVTREEFAKLVVTAFGFNDDNFTNNYIDVPAGAWYEQYVCSATEHGICNGVGDSGFGVGANITRQDMCVMIYNAIKANGDSLASGEITFSDAADIAGYAAEAVGALANAGIVNGVGDNMFDPNGTATRAQAAVIINNALEMR
ncbi:MAG TPA: S-layer homology domain-containing protein [Candidatus Ornithomonoglobus merdipullorum]|uniref:S-layer homology domain-containing protein n=1 Tax=Candidatus Ornithomonoglobus merdipullorum TaxID=2840895 RepID=A0A9D1SF59_9FIRM|nr:S-layer homology domain-containing protein [Candidatus Ornithomonoglobus merdipullorum]